jgi:acetylornithine deacetylase/succinyl-diaminopimelate desuccinylase-like protein
MPRPDNATVRLARAIEALGTTRLPQHQFDVVDHFLHRLAAAGSFAERKALPLLLNPRMAGTLLDLMAKRDLNTAVGMNALLRNTASPTVVTAGKKVNVIPSRATVQVDGRVLPGQTIRSFLDEVQRVVGDDVSINVFEQWEATVFQKETPLFDAIVSAIERHHPGAVPVPFMIPGFTDSAAYARLGATCYGFSPVRLPPELNFSAMYHGNDERIPVDGFTWGLRVLYDLVSDFCRSRED